LSAASVTTVLQIAFPSTQDAVFVEWGVSFDGAAPGTAVECEFFNCTGAASSMNSLTPSGFDASGRNRPSLAVGGAALTAYYKSGQAEGTVANYFSYDLQLVDPAVGYYKQFPLGDTQPYAGVSTFARIRLTAPAAVNAYAYALWRE
jgi:hypothetical protein